MSSTTPTPRAVLTEYLKLRDRRSKLLAEFHAKDGELLAEMDTLENELSLLLDQIGVQSFKTETHSVSRLQVKNYWIDDWPEFHRFVVENNAIDLIERRLSRTSISHFLDEHPDQKPPGLKSEIKEMICVTTLEDPSFMKKTKKL